jgi:hypothetical protein
MRRECFENVCQFTCNQEINSRPFEYTDPVVVINAQEVHGHKENSNEHGNQRQCVEELSCNHECYNS